MLLKRTKEIRFICASILQLKRIPALEFRLDETIESDHKVAPYLQAREETKRRQRNKALEK